jgi:hypothetical protein
VQRQRRATLTGVGLVVHVHYKVWKRLAIWRHMGADDSNNPMARYEAMVVAYEALAAKIAERLASGSAATDAERLEAERLSNELEASRHAAWFQAFWVSPAAGVAPNLDAPER